MTKIQKKKLVADKMRLANCDHKLLTMAIMQLHNESLAKALRHHFKKPK